MDLSGLKPGDEVIYVKRYFGRDREILQIVDRITPKGQIVLRNGKRFNPDGWSRESPSNSWDGRDYIKPVTDERRKLLRREEMLSIIRGSQINQLTDEQLEQIVAMLQQKKAER